MTGRDAEVVARLRHAYEAFNRGQHATVRGAGSGIEMETDIWSVLTLDDAGLVTRVETYLHHHEAEARQAAGLAP